MVANADSNAEPCDVLTVTCNPREGTDRAFAHLLDLPRESSTGVASVAVRSRRRRDAHPRPVRRPARAGARRRDDVTRASWLAASDQNVLASPTLGPFLPKVIGMGTMCTFAMSEQTRNLSGGSRTTKKRALGELETAIAGLLDDLQFAHAMAPRSAREVVGIELVREGVARLGDAEALGADHPGTKAFRGSRCLEEGMCPLARSGETRPWS